jgi:hypothetical protein
MTTRNNFPKSKSKQTLPVVALDRLNDDSLAEAKTKSLTRPNCCTRTFSETNFTRRLFCNSPPKFKEFKPKRKVSQFFLSHKIFQSKSLTNFSKSESNSSHDLKPTVALGLLFKLCCCCCCCCCFDPRNDDSQLKVQTCQSPTMLLLFWLLMTTRTSFLLFWFMQWRLAKLKVKIKTNFAAVASSWSLMTTRTESQSQPNFVVFRTPATGDKIKTNTRHDLKQLLHLTRLETIVALDTTWNNCCTGRLFFKFSTQIQRI